MTNNENIYHTEESFDFRKYLFKIIGNWPLFIISLAIAYSIAYLINRYTEPVYSVSASIMINDDKKSTAEMILPALERFNTRKNIENEISTLKSYSLTQRALLDLDFMITYNIIGRVRESKIYRPFYKVEIDTTKRYNENMPVYVTFLDQYKCSIEIGNADHIKKIVRYGELFSCQDISFRIFIRNDSDRFYIDNNIKKVKYFFYVNNLNMLTNSYRSKLSISSSDKKGSILTLSITGPIAEQEANYLNKLCDVYLQSNLEEKNMASINAIKFIDFQLDKISDSLRNVEERLQNFRLKNKILDMNQESTEAFTRLKNFQSEKLSLDMKLKYCDYLKDYLDSKTTFSEIIAPSLIGINDPILNNAVADLISLYKERGIISMSAQEDNPSLNMLNTKTRKALETLKESLKEVTNTTKYTIKNLDDKIALEEADLFKLPVTERQYINIKRDFDINNSIFTFLLQKRAEAGISKASNLADNKIVDYARADNSVLVSPKRSKNYMTALFLGLLLPIAIIFLMEFLNTRITDIRELSKTKHCNVIGSIGHNNKSSDIPVFEFPKSSLAESFRSLRTNLQFLLREHGDKIVLITSTISGEGKTFCAINLATILAMSNKKTILLALDLRKPRIHNFFNLSNTTGLSTYLIHQNSIQEIVIPTNINNLYLIPSGPVPPNPAELIETEAMDKLIEYLKKEFDYIILDTPPVAIVTDAILLSKYSNASVFVVRQNFSSKDVILLADELSEKQSLKHLNILINDVRVPGYYGYSYKYGSKYGYHYGYGYGYYTYEHDYYSDSESESTFKERIKKWFGA